jgi:hypothetical protein
MFNVMFNTDLDFEFDHYSSIDSLTLTPTGLTLSKRDAFIDENNLNNGIALFERLMEVHTKQIHLVKSYFNASNNHHVRVSNATLIREQHKLLMEGFTFLGPCSALQTKFGHTEDCPICLTRENKIFTTISCSHTFCVCCLASHMEKKGDNHGKCPLCRTEIVLILE